MVNEDYIILRPTTAADLETLFRFQLDPEGRYMAAFASKDTMDKRLYVEKYLKLLQDPTVNQQTIILNHSIIGSIAKFEIESEAEITYWIDKAFWGRGMATAALRKFLRIEQARPIFGRVVFDNLGSQQVLEKANFKKIGEDKGFANGRKAEVIEFIYKLS